MGVKDNSLTTIVIAILVSLTALILTTNFYIEFGNLNNISSDTEYGQYLQDLGSEYDSFADSADEISDPNALRSIFGATRGIVTGTVNVFIIGLESIGVFFEMIPLIGNLFSILGKAIPGFQLIWGMLVTIIGFYIGMRYLQSASNSGVQK